MRCALQHEAVFTISEQLLMARVFAECENDQQRPKSNSDKPPALPHPALP